MSTIMAITKSIAAVLPDRVQLPLRYYRNYVRDRLDPEMFWVDRRLKRRRRFIDVGANNGLYVYHFLRSFDAVDAFEPIADVSRHISPYCGSKLRLHNCALSDQVGELTLNIPVDDVGSPIFGLASLEERNERSVQRKVDIKLLDNYGFQDVDLIKIDVEGHERHVLRGARETINNCRPVIIVEIEQRHIQDTIASVLDEFLAEGYRGVFLLGKNDHDLAEFRYDVHQRPFLSGDLGRGYVNNFVFLPK